MASFLLSSRIRFFFPLRYLPLLGKHHLDRSNLTPLPYIFQLLHARNVHANVASMIMDVVENLLGEKQPDEEECEMEIDTQVPPINVGKSVLNDQESK